MHLGGAGELGLVVGDSLDLSGGGARGIEAVVEPVESELLCELNTDDALAHAENLSIVAQDGALDGEGIVGSDGANTGHLVGSDSDTKTSTADEETTVSLASLDLLGTLDGGVRVGGLVGGGVDTNVRNRGDEGALLENGLDGVLVRDTGLVAGHDDTEGLGRHYEEVVGKMGFE